MSMIHNKFLSSKKTKVSSLSILMHDKAPFDCNSHSGMSMCKLQSETKWILKQLFVGLAWTYFSPMLGLIGDPYFFS